MKLKIRKSHSLILFGCIICYTIGSVFLVLFGIDMYHIKQKRLTAKKYIAEECLGINYESNKQLDKYLTIEEVTVKVTLNTQLGLFVCYDTPEEKISVEDTITRALLPNGKFQKNHKYALGSSETDMLARKMVYDWFDAINITEKYSAISIILSFFSAIVNIIILMIISLSIIVKLKSFKK